MGYISREDWGERLVIGDFYIEVENAAYVVKNLDNDKEEDRLEIIQHDGIDTENRIEKFKDWAKGYLY